MNCASPENTTTTSDNKFATANRIATAIVQIIRHKGDWSPQDLYEKGFTPEEVTEYRHLAEALAAVELKLGLQ